MHYFMYQTVSSTMLLSCRQIQNRKFLKFCSGVIGRLQRFQQSVKPFWRSGQFSPGHCLLQEVCVRISQDYMLWLIGGVANLLYVTTSPTLASISPPLLIIHPLV